MPGFFVCLFFFWLLLRILIRLCFYRSVPYHGGGAQGGEAQGWTLVTSGSGYPWSQVPCGSWVSLCMTCEIQPLPHLRYPPRYWHDLVVATEAGSTHPTGTLKFLCFWSDTAFLLHKITVKKRHSTMRVSLTQACPFHRLQLSLASCFQTLLLVGRHLMPRMFFLGRSLWNSRSKGKVGSYILQFYIYSKL